MRKHIVNILFLIGTLFFLAAEIIQIAKDYHR